MTRLTITAGPDTPGAAFGPWVPIGRTGSRESRKDG